MKNVLVHCPQCSTLIDFTAALAEWFDLTEEKYLSNEMGLSLWCPKCQDSTLIMSLLPMPSDNNHDTQD
jgi:hypothetical protein